MQITYKKESRFDEITSAFKEQLTCIEKRLTLLEKQKYCFAVAAIPTLKTSISDLQNTLQKLVALCDRVSSQEDLATKEKAQVAFSNVEARFHRFINAMEIKKNARIIGKLSQLSTSAFSSLPHEISLEIIKFGTFSKKGLAEKESTALAAREFGLATVRQAKAGIN